MTAKNNMSIPMNFKARPQDLMKDVAMARNLIPAGSPHIGFAALLHSANSRRPPTPGSLSQRAPEVTPDVALPHAPRRTRWRGAPWAGRIN